MDGEGWIGRTRISGVSRGLSNQLQNFKFVLQQLIAAHLVYII